MNAVPLPCDLGVNADLLPWSLSFALVLTAGSFGPDEHHVPSAPVKVFDILARRHLELCAIGKEIDRRGSSRGAGGGGREAKDQCANHRSRVVGTALQGSMKIIAWNYQGLGNGSAVRDLLNVQKEEDHDILFGGEWNGCGVN